MFTTHLWEVRDFEDTRDPPASAETVRDTAPPDTEAGTDAEDRAALDPERLALGERVPLRLATALREGDNNAVRESDAAREREPEAVDVDQWLSLLVVLMQAFVEGVGVRCSTVPECVGELVVERLAGALRDKLPSREAEVVARELAVSVYDARTRVGEASLEGVSVAVRVRPPEADGVGMGDRVLRGRGLEDKGQRERTPQPE